MKKGGRNSKMSNRLLYTLITLGILLVVGVGVYATFPASGTGHNWAEVADVAVTSAQITDGTIANVDISSSAAIAASKITAGAFGAGAATFTSSVTATSFLYSSDKSLKTNIQPLQNPLQKIQELNGVSFNWKSNGEKSIGLIAQDVEKVYPEVVSTDSKGIKSVDYAKLVAVLIEAVKEQQKQIDELKAKLG